MARRLVTDERARLGTILRAARTIAVVGLSPESNRPSHRVAQYLQSVGYRIIPVRPGVETILGERAYADLHSARSAVGSLDVIDIFRRSAAIPDLAADLLAVRPKLVWMQVGVQDDATAGQLGEAGIPVVMDRCLMEDHPWLTSD
jgi:predicted CoA-binding protein